MAIAKSGDADGAHAKWTELFSSADFAAYRPEDQRQALKLLILKQVGTPSASLVETYRVAIAPLTALVAASADPQDYEMLGLCQFRTGDHETAATSFRAGLDRERAVSPESDLCGRLMKHLSAT